MRGVVVLFARAGRRFERHQRVERAGLHVDGDALTATALEAIAVLEGAAVSRFVGGGERPVGRLADDKRSGLTRRGSCGGGAEREAVGAGFTGLVAGRDDAIGAVCGQRDHEAAVLVVGAAGRVVVVVLREVVRPGNHHVGVERPRCEADVERLTAPTLDGVGVVEFARIERGIALRQRAVGGRSDSDRNGGTRRAARALRRVADGAVADRRDRAARAVDADRVGAAFTGLIGRGGDAQFAVRRHRDGETAVAGAAFGGVVVVVFGEIVRAAHEEIGIERGGAQADRVLLAAAALQAIGVLELPALERGVALRERAVDRLSGRDGSGGGLRAGGSGGGGLLRRARAVAGGQRVGAALASLIGGRADPVRAVGGQRDVDHRVLAVRVDVIVVALEIVGAGKDEVRVEGARGHADDDALPGAAGEGVVVDEFAAGQGAVALSELALGAAGEIQRLLSRCGRCKRHKRHRHSRQRPEAPHHSHRRIPSDIFVIGS
ncbi:MAG: hypothetical protein FD160_3184 [Caulobacteraceae bacterium]|nr:MAG: hypothetical protein FD160_3184 [Caulobacteraceae bacterium]